MSANIIKQNNFNIYNAAYFLKHKEKHLKISLFYTCVPKISIWSSFWKKWKKIPGDIILLHVYQKSYDLWFLKYKARQNVLLFWAIFVLSPTWRPIKPKFWKIKKNTWRYYHFTHVHHKWQSYDVWFLRYGERQNFLFWTVFCPFTALRTQKIKILK